VDRVEEVVTASRLAVTAVEVGSGFRRRGGSERRRWWQWIRVGVASDAIQKAVTA